MLAALSCLIRYLDIGHLWMLEMRLLTQLVVVGLVLFAGSTAAADLTNWSRFARGEHPDYLYEAGMPGVETDLVWCSWHEGILHQGLSPNEFRNKCISVQSSGAAKARVSKASNNEISKYLATMDRYFGIPSNGGYKMLSVHLGWVLDHEHRRDEILKLLDQGNYAKIRDIYREEQAHHAHVEYLVYAASDATLRDMINEMKSSR